MGFPMTERCLDCGGLRSEPGAPAICAGWHRPTPADDEDAIHEAGVGYHAPGPYGYGSSHRAEARPSNFTPDEIDAIDEALRDAGLDNDTDIRSRVRTVLETTSEIDKHTVDK